MAQFDPERKLAVPVPSGVQFTEQAHDLDTFHITGWFDFRIPDTFDRHAELVTYLPNGT